VGTGALLGHIVGWIRRLSSTLAWTPDGKSILINAKSDSEPFRIYRIDLDDPKLEPVGEPHGKYLRSFTWTADQGTLLAIAEKEIWEIDPETGAPKATHPSEASQPLFTPY
jgi:hypothetical protein